MLYVPRNCCNCELQLNPEILYLELTDGSKVQSTQKADNVNVVVRKSIYRVSFIVTKLLKDVDLVLGVNWLSLWNLVIDWREQKMHIWTGTEWRQVQGMLLDSKNNTGTVKDFVSYGVDSEKQIPDFTVMKDPKFGCIILTLQRNGKELNQVKSKTVSYQRRQDRILVAIHSSHHQHAKTMYKVQK